MTHACRHDGLEYAEPSWDIAGDSGQLRRREQGDEGGKVHAERLTQRDVEHSRRRNIVHQANANMDKQKWARPVERQPSNVQLARAGGADQRQRGRYQRQRNANRH